ncbi:MAG: hypothetical protein IKV53_05800 [Clostridia bacterium]|nr:hypothetical protein [Clostridia bacterium]
MENPRIKLNKLNYYPVAIIGVGADGVIFFKSRLAELIFPSIKQGSRLDRYTSMSLDGSEISIEVICDIKCTAIRIDSSDKDGAYSIITLFEASYCQNAKQDKSIDSRRIALSSLISQDIDSEESQNMISLIKSFKRFDTAIAEWRDFSNFYIEQCHFNTNETASLEGFLRSLEHIVNNRLDFGMKIKYTNNYGGSRSKINSSLAVIVMNLLSYILVSSTDGCINIATDEDEENVSLKLTYNSSIEFFESDSFSLSSPKIITLLTGVMLCESNGTDLKIKSKSSSVEIILTLNRSVDSSLIFSSVEKSEGFIEDFLKILKMFFEA